MYSSCRLSATIRSQSLWVRDSFLIVRVFFLLVFNVLQGVFPTFVFVKKLALRPLFLLGFFMGCLGWRCFAESTRILLYLVGFFYAGTFFLFFLRVVLEMGYRQ